VPVSSAALPRKVEIKNLPQAQAGQQAKSQPQQTNEAQAKSAVAK